jgi:AcrR family transcriptional regulator
MKTDTVQDNLRKSEILLKPSFDVWLRWADVLRQRLQTIRQIYLDHQQQNAAAQTGRLHERLQLVLDGRLSRHYTHMRYAPLLQLTKGADCFVDLQIMALANIFRDTLEVFPQLSADMQKLLNAPWGDSVVGRLATDLFRGPVGSLNEGIGSGYPRDKQLPSVLEQLLYKETSGSTRAARQTTLTGEEYKRWVDIARRYAKNTGHVTTAGRIV